MWAGVDVGGKRKGFEVALIEQTENGLRLAEPPRREHGDHAARQVASLLSAAEPMVVAVDCPISLAPFGSLSRDCERALKRAVCGIRYTPDRATIDAHGGSYYEWILNGLTLYAELDAAVGRRSSVIECFPTASWTRLGWPRGEQGRSRWTRRILEEELIGRRRLGSVPARLNQDGRDAVAAAYTAHLHSRGLTEQFGELVVPALHA